jgi:UPF0716 protein FxsA
MRLVLLLILAALVVAEVQAFGLVSRLLGGWPLALWCMGFTTLAGVAVLRQVRSRADPAAWLRGGRGFRPEAALGGLLATVLAGLLLLVPGFVSDVLAIPFLLPPVQRRLAGPLLRILTRVASARLTGLGVAMSADSFLRARTRRPASGGGGPLDAEFRIVEPEPLAPSSRRGGEGEP